MTNHTTNNEPLQDNEQLLNLYVTQLILSESTKIIKNSDNAENSNE